MKTTHALILTTALAIFARNALINRARQLKRKNEMSKAKPEALQEWEGEGGALRAPAQTI
jgi:hypothetical protein